MSTSNFQPDFYDRLGVDPSIDNQKLQQQYRLLAKLFHPDVSTEPNAHEEFIRVREAYQALSDAETRDEYDAWLKDNMRVARPFQVRHFVGPHVLREDIGEQRLYLLLEATASILDQSDATPINLMLVLDRSSSMRGERLYRIRQATQLIGDRLGDNDTFGIITFNDYSDVLLPAGTSPRAARVKSALNDIVAEGGTEIARGFSAGLNELSRLHRSNTNHVTHLILLTDGQTYGDAQKCLRLAERAHREGVGITFFGVGTDWNDGLLDEMAERAGGTVQFIDDPSHALEYFDEEILRLQRTVAQNAEISVSSSSDSRLLAVHQIAPGLRSIAPERREANTFRLGNVPINPSLQLLLEFSVTPTAKRSVALAARINVRARPIGSEEDVQLPRIIVMPIARIDVDTLEYPPAVVHAARRARTLGIQREAWSAVDGGDVTKAIESLSFLATQFLGLGQEDLAAATKREIRELQRTGRLSPEGNKAIKYGTRQLSLPPPE